MKFPDDVPTLTSGDVTLRAHRTDDIDGIVEQCTDPVSVRWTTVPLGYDRAMGESWLRERIPEAWESEKEFLFAIEATHHEGHRGFGGSLSLRDEGDRRAELAFGAHPGVRGRGVMTKAIDLLLDWGFAERDIETVVWLANVGNVGSRRVAWRNGFTFGGTMKRWLLHRGEHLDGWVGTLHRDDSRTPKTRWVDATRIEGEHIALRAFDEGDLGAIVEGCSDDRTQHWLPSLPRPYTARDARAWVDRDVERASLGKAVHWAVVDAVDGRLLGNVSLPKLGRSSGEVAYWAHPAARGRGVMTEAVSLLARHAFTPTELGGLGLRRMTLHAAAGNAASRRVAEANGFTEFGRERRAGLLRDGSYDDILLFDRYADVEIAA